jgi:glycosyltransferase involved in cell wall biosynthesis
MPLVASGLAFSEAGMKITVYVSAWNFERWIGQCLQSILGQDYPDFEVICGLDVPYDGTEEKARETVRGDSRFRFINHTERQYPLGNIMTMHGLGEGEIGIRVDGDDYLPHAGVLSRIARAYEDPGVDMTHGTFMISHGFGIVQPRVWTPVVGFSKWCFCHPLTWRRSLAERAMREHPEAYLDAEGKPFQYAGDVAWAYPLAALARKVVTIQEPLYVYRSHPGNEQHEHRAEQLATEARVGPYWNRFLVEQKCQVR